MKHEQSILTLSSIRKMLFGRQQSGEYTCVKRGFAPSSNSLASNSPPSSKVQCKRTGVALRYCSIASVLAGAIVVSLGASCGPRGDSEVRDPNGWFGNNNGYVGDCSEGNSSGRYGGRRGRHCGEYRGEQHGEHRYGNANNTNATNTDDPTKRPGGSRPKPEPIFSKNDNVRVAPLSSGIHALSSGTSFTCAVSPAGKATCWGSDYQFVSTPVPWLSSGVRSIAAGGNFACALTNEGAVKCWGSGSDDKLGDGDTGHRGFIANPVPVLGLETGVIAISAGRDTSCALTHAGRAVCWGDNASGLVGESRSSVRIPTRVMGIDDRLTAISVGQTHACAITQAGGVLCWGATRLSLLGRGDIERRHSDKMVLATGLTSGVVAISAGAGHSCAVTSAGALLCWGDNRYGQLGDGTDEERAIPTPVSGLNSGVVAVSAGVEHTCAVKNNGAVFCWGFNRHGQLGDGTKENRRTPVQVAWLDKDAFFVAVGEQHTCAVTKSARSLCWGHNHRGQLGDGTDDEHVSPKPVIGFP